MSNRFRSSTRGGFWVASVGMRMCRIIAVAVVGATAISCNQGRSLVGSADHQAVAPTPSTRPISTAAAAAPAVPEYQCLFTDQPINIDGNASEEAWQHAAVVDNFRIPVSFANPKMGTKARLLWDRDYLYYFAEMEDTDLYALYSDHQAMLWESDVFEVFLKPTVEKPAYYEFEVNPANATLELFFPARGSGGYARFMKDTRIEMKTAVQLQGTLNHWQDTDKGWSVEGKIRWRDLLPTGGRPNPGEQWLYAMCRGDMSVGSESLELSSSAMLTQVNFHRYEDYAKIRFVGPTIAAPVSPAPTTAPATGPTTGPATAPAANLPETKPFGIASLVPWTTSNIVGYPDPLPPFTVTKAFPKLKIFQPLYVIEEPGTDNLFCVQHLGVWNGPGKVLRFKNDPNVSSYEELLYQDRLIYGMTVHPDFPHNGFIYLISNGPFGATNKQNRISRFTVERSAPYHIDAKSEVIYLEWDSNGHNGGDLGFGPDGYLYHAAGDGSSDSDANLRGQDITNLTSGMLRIDVDHPDGATGKPYSIPKDNPFLATPGARPEIWAYGFRNPWRLSFDRANGDLWVGQNGQDAWEQVIRVEKGSNYGWSIMEGSHPFNLTRKRGPTPIMPPTAEHSHSEMRSLSGGVVYRGSLYPELDGAFIYGDWSTGRIWGVKHDGKHVTYHRELAKTTLQITGFRETRAGEILVVDQGGAAIYKLIPHPADQVVRKFPTKLSETGLFANASTHQVQSALIPYDVNSPLWSDGATKERFIALPPGGVIKVTPSRGWEFPEGTVFVKTFSLPGADGKTRRVETRLLTRQLNQWAGYSYQWNDDQTDAMLVEAGGTDQRFQVADDAAEGKVRSQAWHYPSRTECMVCHTRASNFVLGASTVQLNKDHTYPSGVTDNQLRTLEHLGVLRVDYNWAVRDRISQEISAQGLSDDETNAAISKATEVRDPREVEPSSLLWTTPENLPRLVNPADKTQDLNARARAYLHSNCAICHVDAGGGNALMNLEFSTRDPKARIFDVTPQHDTYHLADAKIIASGRPDDSVLLYRLTHRGTGQMPPLASNRVDEQAVQLMKEWIASRKPPQTQPTASAER